jgi:hypothetical protein
MRRGRPTWMWAEWLERRAWQVRRELWVGVAWIQGWGGRRCRRACQKRCTEEEARRAPARLQTHTQSKRSLKIASHALLRFVRRS